MSKQNDPKVLRCVETTRKVWIQDGYILVKDLQSNCIEICSEDAEKSSGYFGRFSIVTARSCELRALAFALVAAADEMDGIQSTETK